MINLNVLDESTLVAPTVAEIFVTDSAQKKMKEILDDFDSENRGMIRFVVSAGGCSGFMYDLQIVEYAENCQELVIGGVKVLVPNMASHLLDGIEIDYEDKLMGGGFKINNPNAQSSCGCGESFA